jgi:hypothetical protein
MRFPIRRRNHADSSLRVCETDFRRRASRAGYSSGEVPTTPMGAVSLSRLPTGDLTCAVRVIGLTTAGARALGFSGIARVSVERIGKNS